MQEAPQGTRRFQRLPVAPGGRVEVVDVQSDVASHAQSHLVFVSVIVEGTVFRHPQFLAFGQYVSVHLKKEMVQEVVKLLEMWFGAQNNNSLERRWGNIVSITT